MCALPTYLCIQIDLPDVHCFHVDNGALMDVYCFQYFLLFFYSYIRRYKSLKDLSLFLLCFKTIKFF